MMIIEVLDQIRHDDTPAFPVIEADFTETTDPRYLDLIQVRREVRLRFNAKVFMPRNARLLHLATLPQTGGCPDEGIWDAFFPVLHETPVRTVRRDDMPDWAKAFDLLTQAGIVARG